MFNSKIVVRAGWGMYYDRGELYSYLSLPAAADRRARRSVRGQSAIAVCGRASSARLRSRASLKPAARRFRIPGARPWRLRRTAIRPRSPANDRQRQRHSSGAAECRRHPKRRSSVLFGGLRAQQQTSLHHELLPRHSMAAAQRSGHRYRRRERARPARNHSDPVQPGENRHPDQPAVRPGSGLRESGRFPYAQFYTYGYTVQTASGCGFLGCTLNLPNGQPMQFNTDGGNVDERAPYIGYSADSEVYTAAGISAYNALQVHVEKRISHGLQAGFSYTYSRSIDEQSALGLYYNGNNPQDLRGGYGPSDFDRTHVFNIDYHYELPAFFGAESVKGKVPQRLEPFKASSRCRADSLIALVTIQARLGALSTASTMPSPIPSLPWLLAVRPRAR